PKAEGQGRQKQCHLKQRQQPLDRCSAPPAGDQAEKQTGGPEEEAAVDSADQCAALGVVYLTLGQSRESGGNLAANDGAAGPAARTVEPADNSPEKQSDQAERDRAAKGPAEYD